MLKAISSPRRKRATKARPTEITTFANAVRYLSEQVNFERMRVVRYDDATFKLDQTCAAYPDAGRGDRGNQCSV